MVFPKINPAVSFPKISHSIIPKRSLSENDAMLVFLAKLPRFRCCVYPTQPNTPELEASTIKVEIFAIGQGRFRVCSLFLIWFVIVVSLLLIKTLHIYYVTIYPRIFHTVCSRSVPKMNQKIMKQIIPTAVCVNQEPSSTQDWEWFISPPWIFSKKIPWNRCSVTPYLSTGVEISQLAPRP